MSADNDEIIQMNNEGLEVETLVSPVSAVMKNGRLNSVSFQRNALGDITHEGGKPKIRPIEGSEFDMPCDTLVVAIGQVRTLNILPDSVTITEDHETSHEKVFIAGDFRYGSFDVITAVEDGKQGAKKVDTFLSGQERMKKHVGIELTDTDGETGRVRDHDLQAPSQMPHLPMSERDGVAEVELGLDEDSTHIDATRCYYCHYKFEIDQDKCIHCDWCIEVAPRNCIKRVSRLFHDEDGAVTTDIKANLAAEATYIWIDSDECIRCGKCLRVCPTDAISMRKMSLNNCVLAELKDSIAAAKTLV